MSELKGKADLSAVRGIGLSGHMHGATLVDASDKVLRPCILWNDTRSMGRGGGAGRRRGRSAGSPATSSSPASPRPSWSGSHRHEPEIFAKVAKVLLPKDYLRLWLTGEHVAEMSDAAGTAWLDTGARDWSDELLAKTGLTRDQMPRPGRGLARCRARCAMRWPRTGACRRGVVVAGGGGDNAAAGIGLGVVKAGQAFVSLGTSGVLFAAV